MECGECVLGYVDSIVRFASDSEESLFWSAGSSGAADTVRFPPGILSFVKFSTIVSSDCFCHKRLLFGLGTPSGGYEKGSKGD